MDVSDGSRYNLRGGKYEHRIHPGPAITAEHAFNQNPGSFPE